MPRLAIAILAFSLLTAFVGFAAGRRRRAAGGELRGDPLPAGLQHLASQVRALSSLEIGLPMAPQRSSRRRVTSLIGVR